jgi:hypothetical protein
MKSRKILIWTLPIAAVVAILTILWLRTHHWRPRSITIQGAVIRRDTDTRKQLPLVDAEVTASDGVTSVTAHSDASGYFKLLLGAGVWPQRVITLNFQHADYHPLDLSFPMGLRRTPGRLFIAELKPIAQQESPESVHAPSVVSNIRVRYTTNIRSDTNIGSAVNTFQVINQGNVPCNHRSPCSPDGQWKASPGSVTLDAGPGNVFRNARASCIAGPCPFTRIDSSKFSNGGRMITASALDWSDTTTFLLEAEVFRDTIDSSVREFFPVIFGRTLHFTLPPTQEGVSIEAEVNGTQMVFLLGPDLYLSWADCTARTNSDGDNSTVYQCELKPGYRFESPAINGGNAR